MVKRRSLTLLLAVVVLMLATMAPAGAVDVEVGMPDGTVTVADGIFFVEINGEDFLNIRLHGGAVEISGNPGVILFVTHPDGGGGGICIPPNCP